MQVEHHFRGFFRSAFSLLTQLQFPDLYTCTRKWSSVWQAKIWSVGFSSRLRVKLNCSSELQIIQVATKDRTSVQQLTGHNDTSCIQNNIIIERSHATWSPYFIWKGQLALLSLSKGVYALDLTIPGVQCCNQYTNMYTPILVPKTLTRYSYIRMWKFGKVCIRLFTHILLCHASFDLQMHGSVFLHKPGG